MSTAFQEITTIRFFKGDKKKRTAYAKRFPGRWDNDSSFIRAAIQNFMRQLDQEQDNKVTPWASAKKNGKNSLKANTGGQR